MCKFVYYSATSDFLFDSTTLDVKLCFMADASKHVVMHCLLQQWKGSCTVCSAICMLVTQRFLPCGICIGLHHRLCLLGGAGRVAARTYSAPTSHDVAAILPAYDFTSLLEWLHQSCIGQTCAHVHGLYVLLCMHISLLLVAVKVKQALMRAMLQAR